MNKVEVDITKITLKRWFEILLIQVANQMKLPIEIDNT